MEKKQRWNRMLPLAVALIGLTAVFASAQEQGPPLDIAATVSKETYLPGDTVVIGVSVRVPKQYHLYGNPLGPGIGKPLTIGIGGAEGVTWFAISKTDPKKYVPPVGDWVWAYEKEAFFFLKGVAGAAGEVKGTVIFDGLICHTSCYPAHHEAGFTARIDPRASQQEHFVSDNNLRSRFRAASRTMAFELPKPEPSPAPPAHGLPRLAPDEAGAAGVTIPAWTFSPLEAKAEFSLLLALLFGFLAGIILNAMPCVLPVLGVKLLSFAQGSGMNRKKAIFHSLFFAAGTISVFLLLASLASFANYSWGRQFQDPKALIAIVTLIVLFALGMFDVYLLTVPSSIANLDPKKASGAGGDFFKGVFATILATPCSGPFLGAVLAWAITQPPYIIFIVYASIGAGMGFPYIALSASRRLAKLLPKPGPWMEDFKKIMGFLLLGFAVYLMFGLPGDLVAPTVLFCVLMSLAVAVYGRGAPWGSSIARKAVSFVVALLIAAGGLYASFKVVYPAFSPAAAEASGAKAGVWQNFSVDSLLEATAGGRPVLLDFTANWCMNCQYNFVMVLTKPEVTDLIREKNVLALKVDMTMSDPVQDSLLRSLGSQSIPFLALFTGNDPQRPIVMRDILTKGRVVRELRKLD